METTIHIDHVKNMSASQFKALRRIASNHSQDIQSSIDCICKEVRDVWEECCHIDLPSRAQLVIVYRARMTGRSLIPQTSLSRTTKAFPPPPPVEHPKKSLKPRKYGGFSCLTSIYVR